MELSKRLYMVASMVEPGSRVADVGCDHGYVAMYLVREGISPWVLAMDVNKGPLERAREHVKEAGLSSYIDLRLSDGLAKMDWKEGRPEADTLLCAGIGGRLACRIMEDAAEKLAAMRWVILQPQSELWLVRDALRRLGYFITDENMIKEDGKFYTVMKAANGRLFSGSAGAEGGEAGRMGELHAGGAENPPVGCQGNFRADCAVSAIDSAAEGARIPAPFELVEWEQAAGLYGEYLIRSKHPVLIEYLEMNWNKNRIIADSIRRQGVAQDNEERLEELFREEALMKKVLCWMRGGQV